jgi:hypothetical protein
MKNFRRLLRLLTALLVVVLTSGPAMGATFSLVFLNLDPYGQNQFVGDEVSADLMVSGLENEDLSAFDITLNWDANLLAFNNYTLGEQLGEIPADAEDWSLGETSPGNLNLVEVSYLYDLSFQADSFTLATLNFTAMEEGLAILEIADQILSDAYGDQFDNIITSPGYIQINPVPVPAAAWLLGAGLLCVIGIRRRTHT